MAIGKISLKFFLLSVLIIIGITIVIGITKSRSQWKTYTNTSYKISFKYPSNYQLNESNLANGIVAWMATLESPNNVTDNNTKIWDIYAISIAARRKMGLTFEEWVKNECNNRLENKSDFNFQGKKATEMICTIGNTNDNPRIYWKIIAIDHGEYVYVLTNNAYQRNSEIDNTFNQLLPTFKLI